MSIKSTGGAIAPSLADVGRHLAARLRSRRLELGLTQPQLAASLGITARQLHRYETATTQISTYMLVRLAEALGVEPWYFFAGLPTARPVCVYSREPADG